MQAAPESELLSDSNAQLAAHPPRPAAASASGSVGAKANTLEPGLHIVPSCFELSTRNDLSALVAQLEPLCVEFAGPAIACALVLLLLVLVLRLSSTALLAWLFGSASRKHKE